MKILLPGNRRRRRACLSSEAYREGEALTLRAEARLREAEFEVSRAAVPGAARARILEAAKEWEPDKHCGLDRTCL